VYRQESNSIWKNCGEIFRQVFLPAVQSIDGNDQWHRPLSTLGQSQVSDDLRTFKRNMHDLQRRIEEAGMRAKCLERLGIRTLFPGRGRHWPAAERIQAPGANVIGVSLGRIA